MLAEKFPLEWPTGYPRCRNPKSSRFGNVSFAKSRDEIFQQLKLMVSYYDRSTIVLSTNIPLKLDGMPYASYRQPDDKGVAVYFIYNKEQVVLCCDSWNKIEHNMWSVAKTIESLRAIERWGVSDFLKHSFSGFNALPPAQDNKKHKDDWWVVLGYQHKPESRPWDWTGVAAQYKSLAKLRHPDMPTGSTEKFQELNQAFDEAKKYYNIN